MTKDIGTSIKKAQPFSWLGFVGSVALRLDGVDQNRLVDRSDGSDQCLVTGG